MEATKIRKDHCLVVLTSLKHIGHLGWWDSQYMGKNMLQTTKQIMINATRTHIIVISIPITPNHMEPEFSMMSVKDPDYSSLSLPFWELETFVSVSPACWASIWQIWNEAPPLPSSTLSIDVFCRNLTNFFQKLPNLNDVSLAHINKNPPLTKKIQENCQDVCVGRFARKLAIMGAPILMEGHHLSPMRIGILEYTLLTILDGWETLSSSEGLPIS